MLSTLESLVNLARERKKSPVDGSYTNKLLSDKSLSKEKVLEEINELIEAVESNSNKIHEAADIFYHLIMYLEANDIKIEDVMNELNKRKVRSKIWVDINYVFKSTIAFFKLSSWSGIDSKFNVCLLIEKTGDLVLWSFGNP